MTGSQKSTRQLGLAMECATPKFIELPADSALEVVMMFFPGDFVASRLTGDFNRCQPSVFHECLDIAVHRGQADAEYILSNSLQNLFGRKWAIGKTKG
jgi:hypothetical protein